MLARFNVALERLVLLKSVGGVEGSDRDGLKTPSMLPTLYPALTSTSQVRVHPWRVHPDHRVHLADGHAGGDAQEVPQPHLLHPVLPKRLHRLALGGHRRGLPGHAALHGGVEQRAGSSAWTRREGEEGGVTAGGWRGGVAAVVERIRSFF